MSYIRKIDSAASVSNANIYVGLLGHIFYDGSGVLRLSDGVTPGGMILNNPTTVSNFVTNEFPSGNINGINTIFTLAHVPILNSQEIYENGIYQAPGTGNDYVISQNVITFIVAPISGRIIANYRY